MLKKIYRKKNGQYEWVLLGNVSNKPLQYFGTKKPSDALVKSVEHRVRFFKYKSKKTIVKKTRRDGVKQRYHVSKPRKKKKNYGFGFKNKPTKYVSNNEFKEKVILNENNPKMNAYGIGTQKKYTGNQVGAGLAASGLAVPVILPLPLMAGVGAIAAKKIDTFNIDTIDDQGNKRRFPKFSIYTK